MQKLIAALVLWCSFSVASAEDDAALKFVQSIPLPDVNGRIDHFSIDVKGQRGFLGALAKNTVEVVDLKAGRATRRIYTTGGEGFVDVTRQIDADHYERIARIPTGPGARTSMFVPEWRRLYVAVPRDRDRSAELRVYAVPLNSP